MNELPISQADYQALQHYVAQALALPGVSIEAIVLFGSKARGDSTVESDVDLLIVVSNGTLSAQEQLRGLVFDVLLESGVYLSTQILSTELYTQLPVRRPMFFANLMQDGIALYTRPGASFNFARCVDLLALA